MLSKSLHACLLLVPLAGCVEGDRALNDGKCPAGETCSDGTPKGLEFHGADRTGSTLELGVPWTAIGGVQTITIVDVDTEQRLALPWRAELSGALAIDSENQAASQVVVAGVAEDEAMLRIVDPATGALYDRHPLTAKPIVSMAAVSGNELVQGGRPIAWLAGRDIDAGIALQGRLGEHLVDERLEVALADGGAASLERTAWDRVVVRGVAAAGTVGLTVSAGTVRDQRVEATVVDGIDAVVDGVDLSGAPTVGSTLFHCFEARLGEQAVLGVAWTFTAEGAATSELSSPAPNCAARQFDAPGQLTITASAGGQSVVRTIDIAPAPRSRTVAPAARAADRGSPGDRAAAAAAITASGADTSR